MNTEFLYHTMIYMTLASTLYAALELSFVPRHFYGFVYPVLMSLKPNVSRWIYLHIAQMLLALLAGLSFAVGLGEMFQVLFIGLSVMTFISYNSRKVGRDGADQIRILALLSISLSFLATTDGSRIVMGFMGLQVLLGYATSGIAKLASPHWRKGHILHQLFGTNSYGIPGIGEFLSKNPSLEKLFSYLAIITMLSVPVFFLFPYIEGLALALAAIFAFHFTTMIIMGLNDFVLAFPIGYPGIFMLHGMVHGYG